MPSHGPQKDRMLLPPAVLISLSMSGMLSQARKYKHIVSIPVFLFNLRSEIQERPSGTLLCIYRGHPVFTKGTQPDTYSVNSINAVAWSPKGPYVASASCAHKSVHVWHAFTGKKIQTYSKHSSLPFQLTI